MPEKHRYDKDKHKSKDERNERDRRRKYDDRDEESEPEPEPDQPGTDGDANALDAYQCDCEDCESAVSPSAYLAYLLRYATTHLESGAGSEGGGPGVSHRVYKLEAPSNTGEDDELRTLKAAVAVTDSGATDDLEAEVDDWLSGTGNYDGLLDRRGQDRVTVRVGTTGPNGSPVVEPAAVLVGPGTTVDFEWDSGPYAMFVASAVPSVQTNSWISYPAEAGASESYTFELDPGATEDVDAVSLDELAEEILCQPLDRLPVGCEAGEETVRHVRLCVESLLKYMETNTSLTDYDPDRGEDYPAFFDEDDRMAEFRLTAYRELLDQWGTSREDLRDAAHDEDSRERTADAIGVPESVVSRFRLDHSADLLDDDAVSETNLEDLFGLPRATILEDVKNLDGIERTDQRMADLALDRLEEPWIRIWRHEQLREDWHDRDYPADPYPFYLDDGTTGDPVGETEVPVLDPDLVGPDDVRPGKPAAGTDGAIPLSEDDWPSTPTSLSDTPAGMPETDRARTLWEDRRKWVDARLDDAWGRLPTGGDDESDDDSGVGDAVALLNGMLDAIDYDTDGQGDSHDAAWYPSTSVTEIAVGDGSNDGGPGSDPGADTVDLELDDLALETPGFLADLLLLYEQLTGDAGTAAEARERRYDSGTAAGSVDPDRDPADAAEEAVESQLHLTREAFGRLVELLRRYFSADDEALTDEEWWEVASITAGARKRGLFDVWIAEEKAKAVHLDRRTFWLSRREPKEGRWSGRLQKHDETPENGPTERSGPAPFVDPERLEPSDLREDPFPRAEYPADDSPSPADLADEPSGRAARTLYEQRKARLAARRERLIDRYEEHRDDLAGEFEAAVSDYEADRQALVDRIEQWRRNNDGELPADLRKASPLDAMLDAVYGDRQSWADHLASIRTELDDDGSSAKLDQLGLTEPEFERLRSLRERAKPTTAGELSGDDLAAVFDLLATGNPLDPVLDEVYRSERDGDLSDAYGGDDEADWRSLFARAETAVSEADDEDDRPEILKTLRLTREEFEQVRRLREESMPSPRASPPAAPVVAAAVATLTSTWKRLEKYDPDLEGNWIAQETDADVTNYWDAYKARLPKWRASRQDRSRWQEALQTRSRLPIIDPDRLDGVDDLAEPGWETPGFELWRGRKETLSELASAVLEQPISTIRAASDPDRAERLFDDLIASVVGVELADLRAIEELAGRGNGVEGLLARLDLTSDRLSYLLDVDTNLGRGAVTDGEWDDVKHVLVQVWKQRQYGRWHREEWGEGVLLDPDQFDLPAPDDPFEPPADDDPVRWRVDVPGRWDWEDTLETRLDQLVAVDDRIDEAVAAAEREALPILRELLVDRLGAERFGESTSVEERAERLTERLFVDVESYPGNETTRLSQAITSLQSLIDRIRTGAVDELAGVSVSLDDPDFGDRWEWLGSYRTWKAAMGVYLYPENVLLPTLRPWQTKQFVDVVDDHRGSREFTQEDAAEVFDDYLDHLADLDDVRLDGGAVQACFGEGTVSPKSPQTHTGGENYVGYVFALPETHSTELYCRTFDPAVTNRAHSELWPVETTQANVEGWERFDLSETFKNADVSSLIGASYYDGVVYLFLKRSGDDRSHEVGYLEFDVAERSWSKFKTAGFPVTSLEYTRGEEFVTDVEVFQTSMGTPPRVFLETALELEAGGEPIPREKAINRDVYDGIEAKIDSAKEEADDETVSLWEVLDGRELAFYTGEVYPMYVVEFGVDGSPPDEVEPIRFDGSHLKDDGDQKYELIDDENRPVLDPVDHHDRELLGVFEASRNTYLAVFYNELLDQVVSVALEGTGMHDDGVELENRYPVETVSDPDRNRPHSVFYDFGDKVLYYAESDDTASGGYDPGYGEGPVEHTTFRSFSPDAVSGAGEEAGSRSLSEGTRWLVQVNNTVEGLIAGGTGELPGPTFVTDVPDAPDSRGGRLKGMRLFGGTIEEFVTLTPRYTDFADSSIREVLGPEAINQQAAIDDVTRANYYRNSVEDLLGYHVHEEPARSDREQDLRYRWGDYDHNVSYVVEAFFHLPLFLARKLTRSGNYGAALWWYRMIYDYAGQEAVWPGFSRTDGTTADYTPGDDWLTDPIQPHAIAETREDADVRFVLLSLVQCLEEFADEEFGKDTPQSIAKATWLYETALDLLETPHLVEEDDPCDLIVDWLVDAYQQFVIDRELWTEFPELSREEMEAREGELVANVWEIDDFTDRRDAAETIRDHLADGEYYRALEVANERAERNRVPDRYVDRVDESDGTDFVGWVGDRYDSLIGTNAGRLVNVATEVNQFYGLLGGPSNGDGTDDGTTDAVDTGAGASDADRPVSTGADQPVRTGADRPVPADAMGAGGRSWRNEPVVDESWTPLESTTLDAANDLDVPGTTEDATTVPDADASDDGTVVEDNWDRSLDLSAVAESDGQFVSGGTRRAVLDRLGSTGSGVWDVDWDGFPVDPPWVPTVPGEDGSSPPNYDGFDTSKSVMDVFRSNYTFCIPDNPYLSSLRQHARLNLQKIRSGRNIAGMKRELDPYSASTGVESVVPTPTEGGFSMGATASTSPTDYRYETLIRRAKELADLAQQAESRLLRALEKRDEAAYEMKKARQDVELSRERIALEEARVAKARDEVELARRQRQRARIKKNRYRQWHATGKLQPTETAETLLWVSMGLQYGASASHAVAAGFNFGSAADPRVSEVQAAAAGFSSTAASLSSAAGALSTHAQILQMWAAQQRRQRQWELQADVAAQNEKIGDQRITLARDQVDIAERNREVVELRTEHAEDMVEFHRTKFTNKELYDWMSQVLERVFRYYLQQATSVAQLAQRQLAFQRQELSQQFIEGDYWEATSGQTTDEDDTDRKGLTGSARLMRDVTKLEQYEFETDERKLQVEKTISLAELDPLALQQLRETGEIAFSTTLDQFDEDHPGLYKRQIKDVSVSIVALTPPTEGINAKLRTSGISRLVVGGDVFREKTIQRDPETVVLDRAVDGAREEERFTLTPREQELLRPFENSGVATDWELELPRAANDFEYDTIADVRLTIEYTALESADYRQQVIDRLPTRRTVERGFSFQNHFADAWYELNDADRDADSVSVTFTTDRDAFPSNLDRVELDGVQVYLAGPTEENVREDLKELQFTLDHADGNPANGRPVDGIVDTGGTFSGDEPDQEWTLTVSFPDNGRMSDPFGEDVVEDLLLVMTVEGRAAGWPP